MPSNQDAHFLDSKTLLAVLFLAVSWFLWDYYMRTKYPDRRTKKAPAIVKTEELEKNENQKKAPEKAKKQTLYEPSLYPEKEIWFKGERLDILFSSKGFGIKKVKIKNYYDRQNQLIEFESLEKPFFSTHFSEDTILPFEITQEDSFLFSGNFSSDKGEINKQIEIDESRFVLNVHTEIISKTPGVFSDLKLFFFHPFLSQKGPGGFFKIFFIYGRDVLRSFTFYKGKERERLSQDKLESCENQKPCRQYSQTQIMALGGKYFGKAFINQADLLPKTALIKDQDRMQALIHYQLLNSKKQKLSYQIFLGPKALTTLEKTGEDLKLWLDFGFFSWLARPILIILTALYKLCQNWGLAIVLLTFVIRLLLLPINIKSYKSMKVMQQIQPEIKEIRKTHKTDPKKMNVEVMALMKKHKANPLGGCLPMFLQFPVFFALYRVLGESIELYQSPFFFWIQDLSLKDPYYVFPVLAGLILFVQQTLTPMNLPKEQARIIKILPLVFSVFMLNLPSGLTLYICVSSLFGLVQQYFFVKLKSS